MTRQKLVHSAAGLLAKLDQIRMPPSFYYVKFRARNPLGE
jgi:hypothetical protein